jgi:hypothetical protein
MIAINANKHVGAVRASMRAARLSDSNMLAREFMAISSLPASRYSPDLIASYPSRHMREGAIDSDWNLRS